jgi:hypothetical protein
MTGYLVVILIFATFFGAVLFTHRRKTNRANSKTFTLDEADMRVVIQAINDSLELTNDDGFEDDDFNSEYTRHISVIRAEIRRELVT